MLHILHPHCYYQKKYWKVFGIIFLTALALFSQKNYYPNISGTVKDFKDKPISDAVVTSLENNLIDTSDHLGAFSLAPIPIVHNPNLQSSSIYSLVYRNNKFSITVREPMNLSISLFNLQGREIQRIFQGKLGTGSYQLAAIQSDISDQITIIRVQSNQVINLQKLVNTTDKQRPSARNLSVSSKLELSKNNPSAFSLPAQSFYQDIIDTLVVTHTDYLSKRVWIYKETEKVKCILWEKKYLLTSEIPDWQDLPETFSSYDTSQLYDLIDGGATLYNEFGLNDGFYYELEKKSDQNCAIHIMNFGNAQNSQSIYEEQKGIISSPVAIPGFSESIALGDELLGGAIIFAHFNRFYLELSFTGYNSSEEVKADARQFLEKYQSIME